MSFRHCQGRAPERNNRLNSRRCFLCDVWHHHPPQPAILESCGRFYPLMFQCQLPSHHIVTPSAALFLEPEQNI